MNDAAMSSLAMSLLGSVLWTACIASIGLAWYLVGGRAREKTWIRNHGLMLLVYFRNVDWRCCQLQELLMHTPEVWKTERGHLMAMLVKLEADLDAFDRLAKVWARRLDHFPVWYPYARTIRAFLEAQDELHVALARHLNPLMHYLERARDSTPLSAREDNDCKAYIDYFLGARDRLWGSSRRVDAYSSPDDAALESLRNIRLSDRLQAVFACLGKLVRLNGDTDPATLRIWSAEEAPSRVWFRGNDDLHPLRPVAPKENRGAASPRWVPSIAQRSIAD